MNAEQKDGALHRSSAQTRSERTKSSQTRSGKTRTSSSSSLDENASFAYSYDLSVLFLLQGRPCSQLVSGGFRRLLNSVLESGDLLGFIDACSLVRSEMIRDAVWDPSLLKGIRRRWVRGLVSAIQHAVPLNLVVHPSDDFNRIATFLGWLKRLPVQIRPTAEAVDAYLTCDRRISSVNLDECVYLPMLREIWDEWFDSFKLTTPFLARHGSGSTADCGRIRHHKWRNLTVDRRASICLKDASLTVLHGCAIGDPNRTSKVVFVPKQAGKDRAICMEPAWLQYLQQGVASQLIAYTHSKDHPLHRLVDIFSQEKNRELCGRAFYEGYATIDLTDASDSVSWELLRRLTVGMRLYAYLFGTRSTSTIIDGRVLPMAKFAPMGSALCFPIECYVFSSIAELAYRIHYGRASAGYRSGIQVYGDDIIVPQEIYHLTVDILQSLGFIVNPSKSYSSGAYFESCGVEYLLGAKIETIKHPRAHILCQDVCTPERVGMITDLSNSMYCHGYTDARRRLLRDCQEQRVVVGGRAIRLIELIIFDEKHCFPVIDSFEPGHLDRDIQRRVRRQAHCISRLERAPSDYQDWQSRNVRRTREQRKRDLYRNIVDVPVDDRFSRQAVISLSKFGFFELLRGDDVHAVGSQRTGRLRQKLVYKDDLLV